MLLGLLLSILELLLSVVGTRSGLTYLRFILDDFDTLFVVFLLDLFKLLALSVGLVLDVQFKVLSEVLKSFSFPGELSSNHWRKLQSLWSFGSDFGSALKNLLNDSSVVDCSISQLSGRWQNQKLHSLPEIKMEVLIPNSAESNELLSPNVPHDESAGVWITVDDHLWVFVAPFSYEMNWFFIDIDVSVRNIPEFNPFVKHVHGGVKSCIDVVSWVIFPHPLPTGDKGWVFRGCPNCENSWMNIVMDKRKSSVWVRNLSLKPQTDFSLRPMILFSNQRK